MVRRWTPQRLVRLRRIRVAVAATATLALCAGLFAFTARKTVALDVDGRTRTVTTYAMSTARLLESQGVRIRSHDVVQSSSGGDSLRNHSVVTVRSAYQATVSINGQEVPFWTTATSIDQLLRFFDANEHAAAKITVNIHNVYNKLTGGLVINHAGPVTVIADGTSSVAPDGRLPAASILDAKGITLNKEDRVDVEREGGKTILRVRRVTHGQESKTVVIPHGTQTVVDSTLAPGQTVIRREGTDGEEEQVYNVTYVDGVAESRTLASHSVTRMSLDTIVAVGPQAPANGGSEGNGGNDNGNKANGDGSGAHNGSTGSAAQPDTGGGTKSDAGDSGKANNSGNSGNTGNSGGATGGDASHTGGDYGNSGGTSGGNSGNSGNSGNTANPGGNPGGARLWHPDPATAQTYAAGAAAQYGWTGNEWDCLVKLWTRESNWWWYAENPDSGAYGIPQSLPGSKMATFGADWRNDAAIQIDWGLNYIHQTYGSPSKAWEHSENTPTHWY